MKKALICMLCTALLCLTASCALGDLARGDSGKAVRKMQEKLAALGFPVGAADGKFGAVTEKAVRAWRLWRWNGEGSVMTDDDLFWLDAVYALAFGQDAEEEGEPDTDSLPAACMRTGDGIQHCERHLEEQTLLYWLGYEHAPQTLRRLLLTGLRDKWTADIGALCDERAETAEEQRALFHSSLEERRTAWRAETDDEISLLERETAWLDETGVNLCSELHGAESQP